jgi:hypothetical protein
MSAEMIVMFWGALGSNFGTLESLWSSRFWKDYCLLTSALIAGRNNIINTSQDFGFSFDI